MSSTFFGFFDKVFIVLLGKVYIVVLCKCVTKCRGKRWKHTAFPFSQRGNQLKQKILAGEYSKHYESYKRLSDLAKDFLDRFLQVDPENRISLEDVVVHWRGYA